MEKSSFPQPQRVFVTGDLNIDSVVTGLALGGINRVAASPPTVGGSAYNAAVAFAATGLSTLLYGKVGEDDNGTRILSALERTRIHNLVSRDRARPTGTCTILFFRGDDQFRTIYYPCFSANDYDPEDVAAALHNARLLPTDFVFASLHMYDQTGQDAHRCRQFLDRLRSSGAQVIIDIVPHMIYERIDIRSLLSIVGAPIFMLIGEYRTFLRLVRGQSGDVPDSPCVEEFSLIVNSFPADCFDCRYGIGNISEQTVFRRGAGQKPEIVSRAKTGYEALPDEQKRGFGDWLTAATLSTLLSPPVGMDQDR